MGKGALEILFSEKEIPNNFVQNLLSGKHWNQSPLQNRMLFIFIICINSAKITLIYGAVL